MRIGPSLSIARALDRGSTWLREWGPIVPLLGAEFILWTGFGALLPVMPLYFTEHGVDVALLGVVIAAWPAARLVTEPLFGVLADRTRRVPLMILGLVIAGASVGAMAIWTAPVAFVALRAVSGLGTALYDPAARGYLTDSAPPGRLAEVFGFYSSAQMGGILLGPAIGGIGTALVGGYEFVLVLSAFTTFAAAIAVALRVPELRGGRGRTTPASRLAEFPGDIDRPEQPPSAAPADAPAPVTLWNRFLAVAIVVNLAGYFGGGLYETIWALFVTDRGGGVELVGLTFATFGLTTIIVGPLGGRIVDRRGPFPFLVLGLLIMVAMMVLYPSAPDPLLYIPMVAIEAIGFAFLGPATYAVIARGTPAGRSSTAQGIAGAAGTVGTIAAALATGVIAATDLDMPFYVGSAVVIALLVVMLAVGGNAVRAMRPAAAAAPTDPSTARA
ncbi:MAG TPA: MFS transporter [Candidatus Limnocylindrales bacterium]|nr:MFS transporter [Candidatus Limnocylindrales bacterium]